jgi:copper chaperone CopZ
MNALKVNLIAILTVFSAAALAETAQFQVKGMMCGECVKAVKAQVCGLESVKTCDVKVGSVVLTSKPGSTIDVKAVEALVAKAGDYKVVKSEVKK